MINIIQRRKIWFSISLAMVVLSIAALAMWGLKFGIDFTGGTMMEVGFTGASLSSDEIKSVMAPMNLGEITVQPSQSGTVFLKFKDVDETTHQQILAALDKKVAEKLGAPAAVPAEEQKQNTPVQPVEIQALDASGNPVSVDATPVSVDAAPADPAAVTAAPAETTPAPSAYQHVSEKSFESIGPSVGNELKSSATWALAIAVIAIILYIAWAFRKVSYPISSYKYGIIAATALVHDVLSTVGVFAILGHFWGMEVGISFIAALLTILGYSNHDTIVVFDRIRENLFRFGSRNFEETVNGCVNETLTRSINTSFTVILTLSALFLFGGESIRDFVLALIIGVTFGTYSSIFLASPLLVTWQQYDDKKKK
jgi:preprotein translocase subunit SecF